MIKPRYVLFASFVSLFFISGLQQSFSVLFEEFRHSFEWSSAQISLAASLSLIVSSASNPTLGGFIDRHGARTWMIFGTVLTGTSMFLLGTIQHLWQLYILYGIVMGLTFTSSGLVASTAIVGKWFEKRSGPAFGVLQSGMPLGQAAIISLSAWLVFAYGWRNACFVMGALVLLPLTVVLMWAREPSRNARTSDESKSRLEQAVESPQSILSALKDKKFQIVLAIQFLCGTTDVPVLTHWIPIGLLLGMDKFWVANALGLTTLLMFIGTLVFGFGSYRYRATKLLTIIYAGRTLSFVFLLAGSSIIPYVAFVLMFGITLFGMVPIFSSIVLDLFGEGMMGRTNSINMMTHSIGAAVGTLILGIISDYAGAYVLGIVVMLLASFVATLFCWFGSLEKPAMNKSNMYIQNAIGD